MKSSGLEEKTVVNSPVAYDIKVATYDDKYYSVLETWWKGHKWTPVPKQMLTDIGYIIIINNMPVVAGFLVTTNSEPALIEWIVKNPEANRALAKVGLNELYDALEGKARKLGYKMAISFFQHKGLKDFAMDRGYTPAEEQIDVFVGRL